MITNHFRNKLPIYVIASYIFLLGIGYITTVLIGLKDHSVARSIGSPVQSVLLGLGLIYLSASLLRGLFRAWLITLSLVGLALFRELILLPHSLDVTRFSLLLIAGTVLLFAKNEFQTQSERSKFRTAVFISLLMFLVALLYGTVGFTRLPARDFEEQFTLTGGFRATLQEFTLSRNQPHADYLTRRTEAFLLSLRALGVASILLAGYSFLQPLIYRREHSEEDLAHARRLLEQYGGNSEDFFKLWPRDKHYMFSADYDAAIAYKVRAGVALSVGDPFGSTARYDSLIQQYLAFCAQHSFTAAFVHVTKRHQALYKQHGFFMQKIGEEAVADLNTFVQQTVRNKKWRHVINKFEKAGYQFELRKPPHSERFIEELSRISDSWLETPGRSERGFVMGYFDQHYVANCTIAIVRNEEKQIAGFVNLVTSFDPEEANMDLFRQRSGSPTNMTDYLLAQVLIASHEAGFRHFNLGLCPLVGLDDEPTSSAVSRALTLVYNFGGKFYSFKGLYRFKSKFEPRWRSRYIAVQPGALGIVKVAQAIHQAMKVENEN